MQDNIEKIKSALSIKDVVSKHVKLQKKGVKYVGICPFHKEKTPSFQIDERENLYYCFGCSAGGDIFTFTEKYFNISFNDAIIKLAEEAGVQLKPFNGKAFGDGLDKLYTTLEKLKDFYCKTLKSSAGVAAYKYAKDKRQLDDEVIKKFEIGYAPIISMGDLLKEIDSDLGTFEALGLIRDHDGRKYNFFTNRLMIPIKNYAGNVIAFGGRSLDGSMPKYINSSESSLFKKSELLFNYNNARQEKNVNRNAKVILVEGYMDTMVLDKFGFKSTVACLGTAITENQLKKVFKLDDCIYLCFNSDNAGIKASRRAIEILLSFIGVSNEIKIINLNPYKDVDEFLHSAGKDSFNKLFNSAAEWQDFIFNTISQDYNFANPNQVARLESELNNVVEMTHNSFIKKHTSRYFKDRIYHSTRLSGQKYNRKNIQSNDTVIQKNYHGQIDSIATDKKSIAIQADNIEISILALLIIKPIILANDELIKDMPDFKTGDIGESYSLIINFFIDKYQFGISKENFMLSLQNYSYKDFLESQFYNNIPNTVRKVLEKKINRMAEELSTITIDIIKKEEILLKKLFVFLLLSRIEEDIEKIKKSTKNQVDKLNFEKYIDNLIKEKRVYMDALIAIDDNLSKASLSFSSISAEES